MMAALDERRAFLESEAQYRDGELLIRGWQVMQEWEEPYMAALASVSTSRGGIVLELGFGLGISARHIQSQEIERHIVIEAHPDVVRRALDLMAEPIAAARFTLLNGFWQDVVPLLADETFDGILLDTSPLNEETVFYHDHQFFCDAYRLLKPGGVFTFFSDEPESIAQQHVAALRSLGFSSVEGYVVSLEPPEDCRYWEHPSLVVPVVTK